ncbi:CutA1 divalent ion tolerance protein [Solidesulfovibrio fructosivorans JJ]]|uniref:CutA1 divalent ion tolerance protein n=1 Tax=Solidesulfovibrio fructosivorans JJ] TaxID=596151 RepID=E1JUG9_SOLFR|nr:divalent-cation tolerance protein CutA [Solidesulfovibrio fructosivorans]EFL52099.1 CutA1 divalent ion tolerance protein [Solidesulfovibrio fructosivorans JJ]]
MSAVMVYITAPSPEAAESIGRALVTERLAACANILPGMRSIYHWKGAIETAEETVLIAKTRSDLADALTARVKELHDYEVPCAVVVPIVSGLPDFLHWIDDETAPIA